MSLVETNVSGKKLTISHGKYRLRSTVFEVLIIVNSLEGIIVGGNIEEFQPAIKWLKDNQPSEINPKLCHGDFHPGNVMGTWTKVSGIIDWDLANISDPECDVAFFR